MAKIKWLDDSKEISKDFEKAFNQTVNRFAIHCYNHLVLLSPVDTGRYRDAHHLSVGSPSTAMTGTTYIRIPVGSYQPIYLQNNLPYSLRIENGWSGQAPRGVYGLALKSALASLG